VNASQFESGRTQTGRKPLIPSLARRHQGRHSLRLHMLLIRLCMVHKSNQLLTQCRLMPAALLTYKKYLKPTSRLNSSSSGYGVGETVR
jgi:hypothetical protein